MVQALLDHLDVGDKYDLVQIDHLYFYGTELPGLKRGSADGGRVGEIHPCAGPWGGLRLY